MRQICKLVTAVFASITAIACGLHAASAQDVSSPGGYQFFVTPTVARQASTPPQRRRLHVCPK